MRNIYCKNLPCTFFLKTQRIILYELFWERRKDLTFFLPLAQINRLLPFKLVQKANFIILNCVWKLSLYSNMDFVDLSLIMFGTHVLMHCPLSFFIFFIYLYLHMDYSTSCLESFIYIHHFVNVIMITVIYLKPFPKKYSWNGLNSLKSGRTNNWILFIHKTIIKHNYGGQCMSPYQ